MSIPKFIDKYQTYNDQVSYLKSMTYFGFPFGYIISKIFAIAIIGWEKWHFSFSDLFIVFFVDLIILLPLIYNYFKHKKRYNNIVEKIQLEPNKEYTVKALYNYKNFFKNEHYKLSIYEFNEIYIGSTFYTLKDLINKFELDDIKEERLRKLKKLKKLW